MGRMSSTQYTIGRATGRCAATGQPLAPGEHFIATLCERDGEDALQRLDFGSEAWTRGERPRPPFRLLGFWRAAPHTGEAKPRPILDDDAMLELLAAMEPEPGAPADPRREAIRFVLALLLVRRRVLIPEPSAGHAAPAVMRLRPRGASGAATSMVEVRDPGLDEAAMAATIEQIESLAGTEGA